MRDHVHFFNHHTGHPRFHFDEAGDAAAAAAAAAASAAAAAAAKPWHTGLDAEVVGMAQRKNWDLSDPVKAFAAATGAYGGAEKLIGVSPDKMLRLPEASADAATLDAFWQKLGAAKDPKEIDLSTIKSADGKAFDEKLGEVIRATAVKTRAPKDVVLSVAAELQKHFDAESAQQATIKAGSVAADKAALDASWGANAPANMFIANQALEKLAAAANVPKEKAQAAWDALSKVGGIGAATALEMLRVIGVKMGEDRLVTPGGGGNGNLPMTREAAISEITALKADKMFGKRLLAGDREANLQWTALHKIGYGQQNAA